MTADREPPRESGERLLALPRPGRVGKPNEEVRVVLDTFEGHAFIGARIWTQGTDGNWYPTQRGITIRPRELLDVIRGLCRAARALDIDLHPPRPAAQPTDNAAQEGGRRG